MPNFIPKPSYSHLDAFAVYKIDKPSLLKIEESLKRIEELLERLIQKTRR